MNLLKVIILLAAIADLFADVNNYIFSSINYNKYYTNKQLKLESVLTKSKENNLYVGDFYIVKNSRFYNNVVPGQIFDKSTFLSIRQLSYERALNSDFSITVGVLPFNYGKLTEYHALYSVPGNGLMDSASINITGIFLTYKQDTYTSIIGYGIKDLLFNTDIPIGENYPVSINENKYSFKNSNGLFMIFKHKTKDRYIESDLYHIKLIINDINYGDVTLLTVGIKQNNFDTNNFVYYCTLSLSKPTNVNKRYVANKLGESITLGTGYFSFVPYFHKENVTEVVLHYINNNYVNFSFGQPFAGYSYSNVGLGLGVNEKIYITNKFITLFSFRHVFSNKAIKSGTLNYYTHSDKKIKNSVYLGLEYKF